MEDYKFEKEVAQQKFEQTLQEVQKKYNKKKPQTNKSVKYPHSLINTSQQQINPIIQQQSAFIQQEIHINNQQFPNDSVLQQNNQNSIENQWIGRRNILRQSTPNSPVNNQIDLGMSKRKLSSKALHHKSFALNQNRQQLLNLSTFIDPINQEQLFPSLNQTPKVDIIGRTYTGIPYQNISQQRTKHKMILSKLSDSNIPQTISRSRIAQDNDLSTKGSRIINQDNQQQKNSQKANQSSLQAWEQTKINQFQIRNQKPEQVMQTLKEISKIQINAELLKCKPNNLDSTEAIDSFLESMFVIIEQNITDLANQNNKKKIHLSTGYRTDTCEQFLQYLSKIQSWSRIFQDSIEYFDQHIQQLFKLEQNQEVNKKEIIELKLQNEQLIIQTFDQSKKIQEFNQKEQLTKGSDDQLQKQYKQLKRQFDNKTQECESLQYRLKHLEELENMMEPPIEHQQPLGINANSESEPSSMIQSAVINRDEDTEDKQKSLFNINKLKNLEAINQKLQTELDIVKKYMNQKQEIEEVQQTDNIDHFVKIQDLFNKVQIENKSLKSANAKLDSLLQAKDKLVQHLEDKVSSSMIEQQDIIVKLKSEILMLTNINKKQQLSNNEILEREREQILKQVQAQVNHQIHDINREKHTLQNEKQQLENRIQILIKDFQSLGKNYDSFKETKEEQDNEKQQHINELKEQLETINQRYHIQIQQMQEKHDLMEDKFRVTQKLNSILQLKQTYIQQSTDSLVKQKAFLKKEIERNSNILQNEFLKMKQSVYQSSSASEKDYLISIQKAAQQSQILVDIGAQAFDTIIQIIDFFKVEELHLMAERGEHEFIQLHNSSDDKQETLDDQQISNSVVIYPANFTNKHIDPSKKGSDQNVKNALPSLKFMIEPSRKSSDKSNKHSLSFIKDNQGKDLSQFHRKSSPGLRLQNDQNFKEVELNNRDSQPRLKIQMFLQDSQANQDIQRLLEIKEPKAIDKQLNENYQINQLFDDENLNQKTQKNEEFYFCYCPLEMTSILLKFVAEILQLLESVTDYSDLPSKFSVLLNYANKKSDQLLENEIFNRYLEEIKDMIEDKVYKNQTQVEDYIKQLDELNQQMDDSDNSDSQDEHVFQTINDVNHMDPNKGGLYSDDCPCCNSLSNDFQRAMQGKFKPYPVKQKGRKRIIVPKVDMKENYPQNNIEQIQPIQQKIEQRQRRDSTLSTMDLFRQNRTNSFKIQRSETSYKNIEHEKIERQQTRQIEKLQLMIQEQKAKYKESTQQIVQKIIILEQKLEDLQIQKDKEINEIEEYRKNEFEKGKQEMLQRETIFMKNANKMSEKIIFLENTNKELQSQIISQNSQLQEIETLKLNFQQQIKEKEKELEIFKNNIPEYIDMKSCHRSLFGLAFEINPNNQSMVTESMVKYYLGKCTSIDKNKFRIISIESEDFDLHDNKNQILIKTIKKADSQTIQVSKIIMEIVDDLNNIQHLLQTMVQQIKEGTSILYDIEPLYLSLSLGYFGLDGHSNINDFHLIKKKGCFIGQKDLIISVLRHISDPMLFKIVAVNYSEGDEYILDLRESDIYQLLDGKMKVLDQQEPEQLIEIIITNLTLINKDDVLLLVCESKIFFNNIFQDKIVSQNQKQILIKQTPMEASLRQNVTRITNQFKESEYRNYLMNSQFQLMPRAQQQYTDSIYIDAQCQTIFESDEIQTIENFTLMFEGFQKLGNKFQFHIKMLENERTNSVILIICEENLQKKIQICFFDLKLIDQNNYSQYIIYSHCIELKSNHMLFLQAEKIIGRGFFITIYDMKDKINEQFFLVKKSNNQYSKVESSQTGLIVRDSFRSLIFNLTFNNFISSCSQKDAIQGFKKYSDSCSLSNQNNKNSLLNCNILDNTVDIQKLYSIQTDYHFQQSRIINNQKKEVSNRDQVKLFYRNTFIIRCSLEGQTEKEIDVLISLYQFSNEAFTIEVFFYKEPQNISIVSDISIKNIFGNNNLNITFNQKKSIIHLMLDKLFITFENSQYNFKIDNDAVPISEIMYQRYLKNYFDDSLEAQLQNGLISPIQELEKIQKIKDNPSDFLIENDTQRFSSFIVIEGKMYKYKVYFIEKTDKLENFDLKSPRKLKQNTLRRFTEKNMSGIIETLQDQPEFEHIYIEVSNKSIEQYITLLNQKSIFQILEQTNNQQNNIKLLNLNKKTIVQTIISLIKLDKENGFVLLDSRKYLYKDIIYKYSEELGGQFINKTQQQNNEEFDANTQKDYLKENSINQIIERNLIINEEVEMCEYIYDIKIYENIYKENQSVLSYSLEIFYLNDPETVYIFNYPMLHLNESNNSSQSNKKLANSVVSPSISINIDIINIINNSPKQSEIKHLNGSNVQSSEQKKDLQNLIQKYVNNNLLIVVKEQKFPFSLTFAIIETTSLLQWTYSLQHNECHNQLYNSLGKLIVIDQAILDQYLFIIYNERIQQISEGQQINIDIIEKQEQNEESFERIIDIDYDLDLIEKSMFPNLQIILNKEGTKLVFQIKTQDQQDNSALSNLQVNQQSKQSENIQYKIDLLGSQECFISKLIFYNGKLAENQKQNNKSIPLVLILKFKENSLYFKLIQIIQDKQNIKSNMILENLNCKVLYQFILNCGENIDQQNHSNSNIQQNKHNIQIASLEAIQMKYYQQEQYQINLEKVQSISDGSSFDNHDDVISDQFPSIVLNKEITDLNNKNDQCFNKVQNIQIYEALLSGLKCIYSNHEVKFIVKLHQKIYASIFLKIPLVSQYTPKQLMYDEISQSFQMKRQLAKMNLLDLFAKDQIYLNRKSYYDEQQEKLLIINVLIKGQSQGADFMLFGQGVQNLIVQICEIDTNKVDEYEFKLEECFIEEELTVINRKSIADLKKLAKILIDERIIIKQEDNEKEGNIKDKKEGSQYQIQIIDLCIINSEYLKEQILNKGKPRRMSTIQKPLKALSTHVIEQKQYSYVDKTGNVVNTPQSNEQVLPSQTQNQVVERKQNLIPKSQFHIGRELKLSDQIMELDEENDDG